MGPVRQKPIQRTVRTAHLSVLMTVHNLQYTIQHRTVLISSPSYFQPIIIAQMLSIGGMLFGTAVMMMMRMMTMMTTTATAAAAVVTVAMWLQGKVGRSKAVSSSIYRKLSGANETAATVHSSSLSASVGRTDAGELPPSTNDRLKHMQTL